MRFCVVFLMCVATASQAFAATQWCMGRITHALVDGGGRLVIMPEFRGAWMTICNNSGTYGGVSAETCKSWRATVLTDVTTRLQITIMYHDAPACATIPTDDLAPIPAYIMIYNE